MSRMAYVLVTDDDGELGDERIDGTPGPGHNRFQGHLYTQESLKTTLQLAGFKARQAYRVSDAVFASAHDRCRSPSGPDDGDGGGCRRWRETERSDGTFWVAAPRAAFNGLVMEAMRAGDLTDARRAMLAEDWRIACGLREHRRSVSILLCGTSGTGKSTLASLLAARLGITSLISTDAIRHMMRSFTSQADSPLLWASTYQAGDCFDADKTIGIEDLSDTKRAIKGYKAQSEMVMEHLERLIDESEARNESLVVEGVHLSLNFVVRLMKNHNSIVPCLIYISNEQKHKERFAVRSKYMTMDPAKNRYTKYIKNIRVIQDFLTRKADKHLIPKVDNTNVDRSVAIIHSSIFGCLRRMAKGEPMLDSATNTAKAVHAEFCNAKETMAWRGKDMLQVIRQRTATDFPCAPSSSSGPSMFSSDGGEDVSEDSFFGLDPSVSDRVMSSDPEDEIASQWENSSEDGEAPMYEHHTDGGSLGRESTDLEDHDDEEACSPQLLLQGDISRLLAWGRPLDRS